MAEETDQDWREFDRSFAINSRDELRTQLILDLEKPRSSKGLAAEVAAAVRIWAKARAGTPVEKRRAEPEFRSGSRVRLWRRLVWDVGDE